MDRFAARSCVVGGLFTVLFAGIAWMIARMPSDNRWLDWPFFTILTCIMAAFTCRGFIDLYRDRSGSRDS
ncbi:MAG TPA: hypothetical protein VMU12_01070 [Candidatus Paceibacterota bacterium]|nr:hypothetical protein [Candidatus Paceibacterota bacterium]